MLRIKYLAALGLVAVVANIANPVSAQSSRNVDGKGYSLSGDSLMGIDERTANQDFPIFFINQPSRVNPGVVKNSNLNYRRTREQVQINNTPVYLEPGEESLNGNDGFQVQFDLTNTDNRKNLK
ncbi:hypothetical protein Riv7116_3999 [Rivularia sp. PCC 7116]|uniref:hypothetical protein n=1 Tax=Rivularia sp. PCC 7116 TaxID=373994 RepID=UPI00029EE01F|nr:hypothetical protein [Rivularia sp. PCC 7116]AFY56439.1 hypothetical protein Riv7116_3999 [Rivularia sp. PCC 7116]